MHEFSFGVNFALVFPKRFKSGKKNFCQYIPFSQKHSLGMFFLPFQNFLNGL